MATTQKQASAGRDVYFDVEGDNYQPFLTTSHGKLNQQYDDDGNFYPEFTPTEPERISFIATSAHQFGTVVPDSISFKVEGVELTFDTAGNCTTQGAESYFRKDGKDLLVIGNIAQYLNFVSSIIEAKASVNGTTLFASIPADISKYSGGMRKKVSIAPGDNKNFTLTSQSDSVKLKAGVLGKSGWTYNSPEYKYLWEISDASQTSGWRTKQFGTGQDGTLTLAASEVDSYADIRCSVYPASLSDALILGQSSIPFTAMPVGTDCVGVYDASDPLDIVVVQKINKTGTGTEVDADALRFTNLMPDTAYIVLEPTIVIRGTTTPAGSTTWESGILVDPAGIQTRTITPTSGRYKIMKTDVSGAQGKHRIILTGKLT